MGYRVFDCGGIATLLDIYTSPPLCTKQLSQRLSSKMSSSSAPVRGLVFDLGDVLFTWSRDTESSISSTTLRQILSSTTWFDYECGRLRRDEAYNQVAQQFSVDAVQIAEAFSQAHGSLKPNQEMLTFLKELREKASIKVYAMSNVGKEDFAALSRKIDWTLFDAVFTSGEAGMRKPDHAFFHHVLQTIDLAPEQIILVDDKRQNALAAERLGMRGVVFNDSTIGDLRSMVNSPQAKGTEYMYRNARQFDSVTSNGLSFSDNFAQLLILETMRDPSLLMLPEEGVKGTWNFFAGKCRYRKSSRRSPS
jgi:HAD superfamily hydrolase (TIGR01509 family)